MNPVSTVIRLLVVGTTFWAWGLVGGIAIAGGVAGYDLLTNKVQPEVERQANRAGAAVKARVDPLLKAVHNKLAQSSMLSTIKSWFSKPFTLKEVAIFALIAGMVLILRRIYMDWSNRNKSRKEAGSLIAKGWKIVDLILALVAIPYLARFGIRGGLRVWDYMKKIVQYVHTVFTGITFVRDELLTDDDKPKKQKFVKAKHPGLGSADEQKHDVSVTIHDDEDESDEADVIESVEHVTDKLRMRMAKADEVVESLSSASPEELAAAKTELQKEQVALWDAIEKQVAVNEAKQLKRLKTLADNAVPDDSSEDEEEKVSSRQFWYGLIFLVFVLVLLVLAYWYYTSSHKKERRQRQRAEAKKILCAEWKTTGKCSKAATCTMHHPKAAWKPPCSNVKCDQKCGKFHPFRKAKAESEASFSKVVQTTELKDVKPDGSVKTIAKDIVTTTSVAETDLDVKAALEMLRKPKKEADHDEPKYKYLKKNHVVMKSKVKGQKHHFFYNKAKKTWVEYDERTGEPTGYDFGDYDDEQWASSMYAGYEDDFTINDDEDSKSERSYGSDYGFGDDPYERDVEAQMAEPKVPMNTRAVCRVVCPASGWGVNAILAFGTWIFAHHVVCRDLNDETTRVAPSEDLVFEFADGKKTTHKVGEIVQVSVDGKKVDAAVIPRFGASVTSLRVSAPVVGEKLTIYGYDARMNLSVSHGNVKASIDDTTWSHTVTTAKGDCSSALVNEHGHLVGIHIAGGSQGVFIPLTPKVQAAVNASCQGK